MKGAGPVPDLIRERDVLSQATMAPERVVMQPASRIAAKTVSRRNPPADDKRKIRVAGLAGKVSVSLCLYWSS